MNAARTTARRAYDVVLYGATGFVGRQTVAYFAEHAGKLRWALGGRSAEKLAYLQTAVVALAWCEEEQIGRASCRERV